MKLLNLPALEPIPIQTAFYWSKARFIACDCGRRSGKTERAFRKMLKALLSQHPTIDHPKYLWGLPTEDQARNTIWGKFRSALEPLYRLGLVKYSNLNIEIQTGRRPDETPTSSILLVRGMMNPFRVEGEGYCGVVLDEMSDMPPDAYVKSVYPAIMDVRCNGWVILLGVPKVKGVGASSFREICEDWEKRDDPRYARFHWTSDLVLSPEAMEGAKRDLDDKTFREQFMASWETAFGRVYYAFDRYESVFSEERYDSEKPLLIGSDFNVDPMSWVVCQGTKDDFCVLDEISIRDTNTQETLNELYHRWGHHPGGFVFYGDAAGKQRHTCANVSDYVQIINDKRFANPTSGRVTVRYMNSNPSVADRTASVNAMLCNAAGARRMKISKRCTELIRDFEGIVYKTGTREMDKSDPKRTHMSDALGYIIHREFPMLPDKIGSKSAISMREC